MLEIQSGSEALAEAAARAIAGRLAQGLAAHGHASLVATGGRSPGPAYDRLAAMDLGWDRISVTLSDERQVPADDPVSNERLVRERLLTGHGARAAFVSLDDRAVQTLRPFTAITLGMGEDGHVASLIPGWSGLAEAMDPANPASVMRVDEAVGSPPVPRITLTLAALLDSRAIFLLIAGEAKRVVVERALCGEDLPVAAILRQDRVPVRVFWSP